ncbi:hypothetical protein EYF80_058521 [Liparis tanakae]|uniref:Uncharacterized protein n=1 Tax=Liparis tanakae TaxID=230148 RepID=A0A4Z2EQW9_9TELE|nr:hypothetical protein EYF80_058521 [Liparis tanakae]
MLLLLGMWETRECNTRYPPGSCPDVSRYARSVVLHLSAAWRSDGSPDTGRSGGLVLNNERYSE